MFAPEFVPTDADRDRDDNQPLGESIANWLRKALNEGGYAHAQDPLVDVAEWLLPVDIFEKGYWVSVSYVWPLSHADSELGSEWWAVRVWEHKGLFSGLFKKWSVGNPTPLVQLLRDIIREPVAVRAHWMTEDDFHTRMDASTDLIP